jgi:hypothetical protein
MRIEKDAGIEKRFEEVKSEMSSEVRRRTRRSRPWLTCSFIILLTLLVFCLWGLWTVAATGLWKIPLLTGVAYDRPAPTRVVRPGVPVQTIVQEAFTTTLTRRLYEGGGTLTNRSLEVLLSEASLTASLRSLLEESQLGWIDTAGTQLVVDPDVGLELFVPFADSPLKSGATLTFAITTANGNLVVTPTTVMVGSARMPRFLTTAFLKPFLDAELGRLNAALVGYTTFSSIDVLPRELSLRGELAMDREGL